MISAREIWSRLPRLLRPSRRRDLAYVLSQAEPEAPLADRIAWLESLVGWIGSSTVHKHEFDADRGHLQTVRVRFILHLLERNPEWKTGVSATLRSILAETSALELFCQTGLTEKQGFFSEGFTRLQRRFLPRPPRDTDAAEFFARVFRAESDAVWIENLSPEIVAQLMALVEHGASDDAAIYASLREAVAEALVVLATQIAGLGLSPQIRARLQGLKPSDSPFLGVSRALDRVVARYRDAGRLTSSDLGALAECLKEIERSRAAIATIFNHLEESGVSVNLVYDLESGTSALRRTELLLRILIPGAEAARGALVTSFLAQLVRENLANRRVRDFLRSHLHLLSRKIVERAGDSGEHYITRSSSEYFKMLRSAAGGGFITVFTTLFKFAIPYLSPAIFFDAVLYCTNYAGSFVLMQFLGFSLATKQGPMTASALAGKLRDIDKEGGVDAFVDEVCRATRSQFAAAMGNVFMAIPVSIVVDCLVRAVLGHHTLTVTKSLATIDSLNPWKSLTIPLAALTGVLLWGSSLVAGGLENWAVFHKIPEAIAGHRRLRRVFGDERARKLAEWFMHNISGFGGAVSAGILLGVTPAMGHFFGLPIDVRHVTLSSSAVAFAGTALLHAGAPVTILVGPLAGVLVIGLLNFGVSYAMALFVATRARDIRPAGVRDLLVAILRRFRASPREFFLPPKEPPSYDPGAVVEYF